MKLQNEIAQYLNLNIIKIFPDKSIKRSFLFVLKNMWPRFSLCVQLILHILVVFATFRLHVFCSYNFYSDTKHTFSIYQLLHCSRDHSLHVVYI